MTRDAATIGAGLDPVREPRAIRAGERIHVIGAAGAGASGAALLARAAGASVDGCDPAYPSPYSAALDAAGIAVAASHDPAHITMTPHPDRLAVTKALTAVDPDHPELRAARDRHIPIEPWQQVIADAAVGRRLVAVAGTHGKSTTAGWLVHVLVTAGLDPAAFVGALLPSSLVDGPSATARWGAGEAFVVEADEYAGNFDAYRPDLAVLTSAEWDHPDVFADDAAVRAAFEAWLRRMPPGGTIVANVGDPGVATIVERLAGDTTRRVVPVTLDDGTSVERTDAGVIVGRIVAADPAGTTMELRGLTGASDPIVVRLPTAGRHNAANALAVAVAASQLGVEPAAIAGGSRRSPASVAGSSARAKSPASSCMTIMGTIRRPSARPSPRSASANPADASGRSTSLLPSIEPLRSSTSSRRRWPARTPWRSRISGPGATRTRRSHRRDGSPMPWPVSVRPSRRPRRARSRPPRRGWRARSRPATSCS